MLNTLGIIATGALMMMSPSGVENNSLELQTSNTVLIETVLDAEETKELVSYAVTVDATEELLEEIKTAAEEAGMGFTYKVRGVAKKKLVIDMVIENGEDYTMDRIIITEADGVQYIQWEVDEDGKALAFVDDSSDDSLTQNR